jgi:hypothetical protein
MYEYLCLAQSKENFDAVWGGISRNSSTFTVVVPGNTPVDEIAAEVSAQLVTPIPEHIPGQHTLYRIGPIQVTPAVYESNPDGSIQVVTSATYLQGIPGDAYAGIIHLYRKARADEIAGANAYGVGVYKRGENDEGLEVAPLVEKWMGFQ